MFFRWKLLVENEKQNKQIEQLKRDLELSKNTYKKLAEVERRELVLRTELINTQQELA